jgi:2,3-dihydroxy-p-cumate/2,3-dihydroxybenzoate 3,4-dioxygenase
MAIVRKYGFLSVGVSNLQEATEFYTRFARLDVTEVIGDTAFLTGGTDHHWLRLEEGNGQGVKRVGYEVVSDDSFAEARSGLTEWGIDFTEGGDEAKDRVTRWLRFTDPGGTDIELYSGMYERGAAPDGSGVTMESLLHGGWETKNFEETSRFYQEVLGFKGSDFIEDKVAFLRAQNGFHHSLVLVNSPRSAFNHFCVQVESLDDVMRFRNNALKYGVKLRDDLLRHAPSGSIGVYMKDEARDFSVEFCIGHPVLDDSHQARRLPMAEQTVDVWRSPLPEIKVDLGRPSTSIDGQRELAHIAGAGNGADPETRPHSIDNGKGVIYGF